MENSIVTTPKPHIIDASLNQLPSDYHYIFIYPILGKQKNQVKHKDVKPYRFRINSDDEKLSKMIEKLQQKRKDVQELGEVTLAGGDGQLMNKKWTIKQLKHHLKTDRIDGKEFYLSKSGLDVAASNATNYEDECCIVEYVNNNYQLQQNKDQFQLTFNFPPHPSLLTLNLELNHSSIKDNHMNNIKYKLREAVFNTFGFKLDAFDIQSFKVKDTEVVFYIDTEINVFNTDILMNRSVVEVNLKNHIKLPPSQQLPEQSKQVVIKSQHGTKFYQYKDIKNATFGSIYQLAFKNQDEKLFCLQIGGQILTPSDRFDMIQTQFPTSKPINEKISMVGKLIEQKIMFYRLLNQAFSQLSPYSVAIDDIIFSEESKIQKYSSILSKKDKQPSSISDTYLELVWLYTSHEKIKSDIDGYVDGQIYDLINKYLSNQVIIYKKIEEIKKCWIYHFTYSLLKELEQVPFFLDQIVYRGVNYDINKKVGETVMFKSWLSSSENEIRAVLFAIQSHDNKQKIIKDLIQKYGDKYKQDLTKSQSSYIDIDNCYVLYKIKSKTGRKVQRYSCHPHQKQVLFSPYSQFQVTNTYHDDKNYIAQFLVYQLTEVITTKELPFASTNFIIWVDRDNNASNMFYRTTVDHFHHGTVFVQLNNNKELTQWINKNKIAVESRQSSAIFVTNMRRPENNQAGVQTIKIVKQNFGQSVPICLFVGPKSKPQHLATLKKHKLTQLPDYLQIHDDYYEAAAFIASHIQASFSTELPKREQPSFLTEEDESCKDCSIY